VRVSVPIWLDHPKPLRAGCQDAALPAAPRRRCAGMLAHPNASSESLQRASARGAPCRPTGPNGHRGACGTVAWQVREGRTGKGSHRLSDGYLSWHLPQFVSRDGWPRAINPQTPTLLDRPWWPDLGTAVTECRLPLASAGSYRSRLRGYRDSGPRPSGPTCRAGREGTSRCPSCRRVGWTVQSVKPRHLVSQQGGLGVGGE
jgi:hypothetical protein